MKSHWKVKIDALLLVLFLFAGTQSQAAETSSDRYSTQVRVVIEADDKNIEGQLSSYLKRELRSLNDVEIVEGDAEWILYIRAMELAYKGGKKAGAIAVSTTTLSPYDNASLSKIFQPKLKDMGMRFTSNLFRFYGTSMVIGPTDDMQKICIDIITAFDTRVLEDERRSFRSLQELLKQE